MREMTRAQKIRAFNESNAPFYLVDHTDEVSLCCVFHPMPDSVFSLGQEAFNRYAERIGDPVKDEYGLFTHGSGYEWEYVFRKAFENDPNIGKVSFDCEAGGFFCYGESVDMMADFGRRFRQILNDTDSLTELICKAVPEGEQREAELEQLRSTVRGFLMEHPKATVDLVTPEGYLRLTPEDGKALLDGKPALQVEPSEFELIKYPERGTCLYRCGNERYLLQVIAPEYKAAMFGKAGGR